MKTWSWIDTGSCFFFWGFLPHRHVVFTATDSSSSSLTHMQQTFKADELKVDIIIHFGGSRLKNTKVKRLFTCVSTLK